MLTTLPTSLLIIGYILFLAAGFLLLIKGADIFVEGASSVAGNLKVPKILIGLTIVAFGTSAPEFAVSVSSIFAGKGDIVLGNVIGSNILNILLILGCSAMVHTLKVKPSTSSKELPMMLLITTLLSIIISDNLFDPSATNMITRGEAIVILLFFSVFLYYLFGMAKSEKDNTKAKYLSMTKAWMYTIFGIIGIVLGSQLAVNGASGIAEMAHVSDTMIALTIVALGTSLPELITSITATRKGEYDLAIGNVIGSNIFNVGVVLGIPIALFGGGKTNPVGIVATGFEWYDIAVLLLSAVLLFIFGANDRKISKKEGLVFLTLFVVYYAYVIITGINA